MEVFLVGSALLAGGASAVAQGMITVANDKLHLCYFDTNTSNLKPADAALAGTGPASGHMPSNVTLVADLYGGTSPASLSAIVTVSFSSSQGRFNTANASCSFPGGSAQYFQVQVRDST
ncbi:MAG TPA: hypothetical protein VN281_06560 [Verrucomicrobiae bacterium]|nr:hypothetical protein [Verrucomicrobiae bacterium]